LRSEEIANHWKQAVALIVGVLYSIAFWTFWLHLGGSTFVGLFFGLAVWLFSLIFVLLIAVALWPVTAALLIISAGLAAWHALVALV